jgi:hypothetical protein
MDEEKEPKQSDSEVRREHIGEMVGLQELADGATVLSVAGVAVERSVSAVRSRRAKRESEKQAQPKIELPPGVDRK